MNVAIWVNAQCQWLSTSPPIEDVAREMQLLYKTLQRRWTSDEPFSPCTLNVPVDDLKQIHLSSIQDLEVFDDALRGGSGSSPYGALLNMILPIINHHDTHWEWETLWIQLFALASPIEVLDLLLNDSLQFPSASAHVISHLVATPWFLARWLLQFEQLNHLPIHDIHQGQSLSLIQIEAFSTVWYLPDRLTNLRGMAFPSSHPCDLFNFRQQFLLALYSNLKSMGHHLLPAHTHVYAHLLSWNPQQTLDILLQPCQISLTPFLLTLSQTQLEILWIALIRHTSPTSMDHMPLLLLTAECLTKQHAIFHWIHALCHTTFDWWMICFGFQCLVSSSFFEILVQKWSWNAQAPAIDLEKHRQLTFTLYLHLASQPLTQWHQSSMLPQLLAGIQRHMHASLAEVQAHGKFIAAIFAKRTSEEFELDENLPANDFETTDCHALAAWPKAKAMALLACLAENSAPVTLEVPKIPSTEILNHVEYTLWQLWQKSNMTPTLVHEADEPLWSSDASESSGQSPTVSSPMTQPASDSPEEGSDTDSDLESHFQRLRPSASSNPLPLVYLKPCLEDLTQTKNVKQCEAAMKVLVQVIQQSTAEITINAPHIVHMILQWADTFDLPEFQDTKQTALMEILIQSPQVVSTLIDYFYSGNLSENDRKLILNVLQMTAKSLSALPPTPIISSSPEWTYPTAIQQRIDASTKRHTPRNNQPSHINRFAKHARIFVYDLISRFDSSKDCVGVLQSNSCQSWELLVHLLQTLGVFIECMGPSVTDNGIHLSIWQFLLAMRAISNVSVTRALLYCIIVLSAYYPYHLCFVTYTMPSPETWIAWLPFNSPDQLCRELANIAQSCFT